jgi:hypothetical protein
LVTVIARCAQFATIGLIIAASASPLAAADPGAYRGFTLGSATADVMARTGAAQRDLKRVHERPALLEELAWRPLYASGRDATNPESVAVMVFSFVDDQLFKMVIDYDRSRTEGLTKDDMIESLTAVYGPRSTPDVAASPRSGVDRFETPTALARWRQGDTSVTLQQLPYGGGFGLMILSEPLDAVARKAQAAALRMDAVEAPAREAARARAQADADTAAAEKTRTANKAVFTP